MGYSLPVNPEENIYYIVNIIVEHTQRTQKNEMLQCLNSERNTAELLVTDFAEFSTRTVSYFLLNFRD